MTTRIARPAPSDRRDEIELVFEEAVELPRERRDAWLAARCGGDELLRTEVEALLSGLDHAARVFDPQAPQIARMAWDLLPTPSGRIGPYHLVRELGRGGMGVVYLAERADGHYRRRVAIKVLLLGADAEEVRRRFLAEGQILASLSDPHIAQMLDAGVMEHGAPYIVMEYVDGVPITTYCEGEQLDVTARLRLFQDVCSAVHHAHRNLVLHRDVKPGNILVTREGRVTLLDFGIAKLLEGQGSGDHTRTGARPMTPAYASPEQVRGEPLTTASDVYALGLVLYEILAGARAYEVEAHSPAEALALIGEVEPVPPSLRCPRHAAELQGDLDAIVMMALRKEPGQRYGSADQLSADIGRFLDGLPVRAHTGSRAYRIRRFVRRHRAAVLAGTLLLTGIVGGLSVALWQAREATRARAETSVALERAVDAQRESDQVTEYLIDLFDNRDRNDRLRDTLTLQGLLSRGTRRIEQLDREPLAQARLLEALGRVQLNLEQVDEAERLMQRALALREHNAGPDDPLTATSLERLADVQRRLGTYARGESLATRALAINRSRYGNVDPHVAYNLRQLVFLAVFRNNLQEAERLAIAAVAARRANDTLVVSDLETLGAVRWRQGNLPGAMEAVATAATTRRRWRPYPDFLHAMLQVHLADFMRHIDERRTEAVALARSAHAEVRAASGPDGRQAADVNAWAARIVALESRVEAEHMLRTAVEITRRLDGPRHPRVLGPLDDLGQLLTGTERNDEALTLLRESVQLAEGSFGVSHTVFAGQLTHLADAILHAGRVDSAEVLVRRALAIRRVSFGPEAAITALTEMGLARIAAARGDLAQADSIYGWARRVLLRQTTTGHPDVRALDSARAALHQPSAGVSRGARIPQ